MLVVGLLPVGLLVGGLLVEEAEPLPLSVLDLLSDDAAGLDSALPPSPFDAGSFAVDSFAFLRDSDG